MNDGIPRRRVVAALIADTLLVTSLPTLTEFSAAFICLPVCFPHDISITDAARITKLDIYTEMFHRESCSGNPFIFILGVKVKSDEQQRKHCRRG